MEQLDWSVEALADRLLEKLAQAIEELNQEVTARRVRKKDENGNITEEVLEVQESIIDRAGLKQLTAVLKELQAIKAELASLELRESQDGTGVIVLAPRKGEKNGKHSLGAPGEAGSVSGTDGI
jgi:hypothetical protein